MKLVKVFELTEMPMDIQDKLHGYFKTTTESYCKWYVGSGRAEWSIRIDKWIKKHGVNESDEFVLISY